jgi:hypothetical protein
MRTYFSWCIGKNLSISWLTEKEKRSYQPAKLSSSPRKIGINKTKERQLALPLFSLSQSLALHPRFFVPGQNPATLRMNEPIAWKMPPLEAVRQVHPDIAREPESM